jgi:ubiquitin-protein ligase
MKGEVLELQESKAHLAANGITMIPNEDDVFKWDVKIIGPAGTPYEGGVFFLSFEAPPKYP